MTETQRRIRAYKKALPELRERVIAVALLLAMSASMLGSASFAWITLSTAPEVSGMATTVAANGNLEIALAQGDSMSASGSIIAAVEPDKSGVEDSSVIQGIVNSNVTWGNLVNLSEPEYGVNKIALRPALLNNSQRTRYPLYGVRYGEDGRVMDTKARYEYSSYQLIDEGTNTWSFAAGSKTKYGVRAISTVGYDKEVAGNIMSEYADSVSTAYGNTSGNLAYEYQRMVNPNHAEKHVLSSGRTVFQALEGLVAVFAQDKINVIASGTFRPSDVKPNENVPAGYEYSTSCSKYIYDFYEMLQLMRDMLLEEAEGLRRMANWLAYANTPEEVLNPERETFKTVEDLIGDINEAPATTLKKLQEKGVDPAYFTTFTEFKSDYKTIVNDIKNLENHQVIQDAGGIEKFKNSNDPNLPPVYFNHVSSIVNNLVHINSTTINGIQLQNVGGSNATQIMNGGPVEVSKGVLQRFEQRAVVSDDYRINATANVKVRVKILWDQDKTVSGTVTTTADGDGTYLKDLNAWTEKSGGITVGTGDAVAQDTYGMAIDLWLRTNYEEAILKLEGSVKTEQEHARDTEGNYLYTITVDEVTAEVYKKTNSPSDNTYYYCFNDEQVPAEDVQEVEVVYNELIVGYEGTNRVWSEEALAQMAEKGQLVKDSTTQGAGSCFVFYADSKPEQDKLLDMLTNFTIVFIDAAGERLATAKLNTQRAFLNQGKVTVPLEITAGVEYETELPSGEIVPEKGIMRMSQNTPTMITAIVFLDGTDLKNENVLAAGELHGQLNLQFGTNTVLLPPADENLQMEYRTITATARTNDGKVWPAENPDPETGYAIVYDNYNAAGHDVTVTLAVDGVQPSKISGFFVRAISPTQGTRMETVDFTTAATIAEGEDEAGNPVWTATFHLADPGRYIMSDLLVDGMQYRLNEDNHPEVIIPGLTLATVSTLPSNTYMTADSSYTAPVNVTIQSSMGLPSNVTAYFYEKSNPAKQVVAIMSHLGDNKWKGNAKFTESGSYILDSVSVDGQSLDVPNKTELTFRLGMYCEVYSAEENGNTRFYYDGNSVQVKVTANVWDDQNQPMEGLPGVKLIYSINGSELNTTECELNWESGHYSGTLNLPRTGRYVFNSITMGSTGIIRNARVAPELVVSSDAPLALAEFADGTTAQADEWQYALANSAAKSAKLYVRLNDSSPVVWAYLTSADGGTDLVKGSYDNDKDCFVFELTKGGVWTLQDVYCQDVVVDGWEYKPTTADKVMASDKSAYKLTPTQVTVTVVNALNVTASITANGTTYTNMKTAVAFSGEFMETHEATLNLTVKDAYGNDLKYGLHGATWNVDYDEQTDDDFGGYDGASQAEHNVSGTSTDGKTVSIKESFQYAGRYTSNVVVNLDLDGNGEADYVYSIPLTTLSPTVEVSSAVPYIKFTATNPAVGTSFSGINATEDGNVTRQNSISADGYSVVCYYQGEITEGDGCNIANSCSGYTASKATTTVYNLGTNFTSATCTIKSKGEGSDVVFTYSPSSVSNEQSIGSTSGSGSNAERLGIGTNAEATQLIVVGADGKNYTFTLQNKLYATATE